jgi:hypothetical protein
MHSIVLGCDMRKYTRRYNLALSEDLRQVRTGRDLHSLICMDDCETVASNMLASATALNELAASKAEWAAGRVDVDDYVCPKLFSGLSREERENFLCSVFHVLSQVDQDKGGVYMYCNTGNAYGAAASASSTARSLNGHQYAGMTCYFNGERFCSLLEGTKWVMPLTAASLKNPDSDSLKICNEVSGLLVEVTKTASMDPSMDVGGTLLQIYQGASPSPPPLPVFFCPMCTTC